MPTPNRPLPQSKYPTQYMMNSSFDEDFGVNTVELLGYNSTTNTLERIRTLNGVIVGDTPSLYAPLTQVTKANILNAAGVVRSVYVSNDNASVRYFQLHNKATDPAGTNVPLYSLKIPAGSPNSPGTLILDETFFTGNGSSFSTGIGFAISTTFGTFTDSATASEHIVVVHYKAS